MPNEDDDEIQEEKSSPGVSSRKRAREDIASKDCIPESRPDKLLGTSDVRESFSGTSRTSQTIPTDSRMEQKPDLGLYHANQNQIFYRGEWSVFLSSLQRD